MRYPPAALDSRSSNTNYRLVGNCTSPLLQVSILRIVGVGADLSRANPMTSISSLDATRSPAPEFAVNFRIHESPLP